MVLSYYLTKYPYQLAYMLLKRIRKPEKIFFYCRELQDWDVFEPVQKYLKPLRIVSNKPMIRKHFKTLGIKVERFPIFPKAVIMARHSCYKFPADEIIKIGMRHGPYHFKKMTRAENYNQFNLYLMTSRDDVSEGEKIGITCAVPVGYPKLDKALTGGYDPSEIDRIHRHTGFVNNKPTLLFSATWLGSGMSALPLWYQRLSELKPNYNVIVTLHPWIGQSYRDTITSQGIYLIEGNHIPYMSIADIVVGDTSSLLAEACALDKPIITWQTGKGKRSLEKIDKLLSDISLRIDTWDDLEPAINRLLNEPELLVSARKIANSLMFDELDGRAGLRAAEEIVKLLPELKI